MKPFPHQPDDPGVDDINPYAPVTFKESMLGRQTAWLGAKMVGEVGTNHGGRMQRAHARLGLPDVPRALFPATSMEAARKILVREVRDWIAAAGLRA